jgi:hypothetical protein
MLSSISFPIHYSLIILPFDTVMGYGLSSWGSIPSRGKISPLFMASRQALEPTQPPVRWIPKAFSQGVKLSTHLHLMPGSRIVELYSMLPIHLHGMVLN